MTDQDATPETLLPCDKDCMGYICAFHSLPRYVQDELTSLRTRLEEAEEALAATMAYHSNNTGLNMRWHKEALARLPKNWASKKWVLLAALAGSET